MKNNHFISSLLVYIIGRGGGNTSIIGRGGGNTSIIGFCINLKLQYDIYVSKLFNPIDCNGSVTILGSVGVGAGLIGKGPPRSI